MILESIYAGQLTILEPEGQHTGIFKQGVSHAEVSWTGITSDQQADRSVHGGPEKALHQYAIASYKKIQAAFPAIADQAIPGSIGENLSSTAMSDEDVHIGDVYRIGSITVQVSQPRSPCWKINHRYGIPQLSVFIVEQRITGWYYRVLEEGSLRTGDQIELLDRPNPNLTIDYYNQIYYQHRPRLADLDTLINATGLTPQKRERLIQRREFLHHQES
jgi:MOSC domain-containing protein YiiM